MPAPSNANSNTLGRPVLDVSAIETMEDVRQALKAISLALAGAGYMAPAKGSDTTYQSIYGRFIDGEWVLYAGKPTDPMNPDELGEFGLGGNLNVQDEGTPIGTFNTLNFVGAAVVASDGGGGVADITITGSGGDDEAAIWALDPTGGHVIEVSGTTLTLSLKVIKYLIGTSILESEADDVNITYTGGEECSPSEGGE